jgi:hypothetical protein
MIFRLKILLFSFFLFGGVLFMNPLFVIASGNITGYAWSENIGWINFGITNGDATVEDAVLTGYAWNENTGRINLNPDNGGVTNNWLGTLSGYAWGEGVGWINFSGVIINDNGEFTGQATGTNIGTINFDCDNCSVQTTWRASSSSDEGSTGGGRLPSGVYNLPEENLNFLINNGSYYTNNRNVVLEFKAGDDVKKMAVSNYSDFRGSVQEDYKITKEWVLLEGDGEKKVYVKFYTQYGQSSETIEKSIILDITPPLLKINYIKDKYSKDEDIILQGQGDPDTQVALFLDNQYGSFQTNKDGSWIISFGKMAVGVHQLELMPKDLAGNCGTEIIAIFSVDEEIIPSQSPPSSILDKIKDGLNFLLPPKIIPEEDKLPDQIITVPKMAPLSLRGNWNILPTDPISIFVLSPLPKDLAVLSNKFPQLGNTLKEVGISKITDLSALEKSNLIIPGITQTIGLGNIKGIPVTQLTATAKSRIPSEIVFTKTAGGLIDLNIGLSLNNKGETQQRIAAISGQSLQFVIRADRPVEKIVGYIVFKSRKINETSFNVPLDYLKASLMFNSPDFSEIQVNPVEKDEKLVLETFEYINTGNGVYSATVQAPVVTGEYEVITVMYYKDSELIPKEIKFITVVDPEGYVYEKNGDMETRIPGAIVSLYWLNPKTKQYELWPARDYQQENPQTTGVSGNYSFLVPEGNYYLKVDAPGYLGYDGKAFKVTEGSGVHINIELKTKNWWLKSINWQTLLLVAVVILLLYNFYKDKKRQQTI